MSDVRSPTGPVPVRETGGTRAEAAVRAIRITGLLRRKR